MITADEALERLQAGNAGFVVAALRAVRDDEEPGSDNLRQILYMMRPAIHRALADSGSGGHEELVDAIVRENVRDALETIRNGSGIIRQLIAEDGLQVVGAEYSLATGAVEPL